MVARTVIIVALRILWLSCKVAEDEHGPAREKQTDE
jgi:hypothetical protein